MTARRMPWAHVAPAMQLSYELTRSHQLGSGPRMTLQAIHYLLGLRQVLQDQISTAQLAREIGLWDGTDECPRGARETIGRHLKALSEAGAITYNPAPGRGRLGTIQLPEADPVPGCACTDCRGKAAPHTRPSDNKVASGTRPSTGKAAPHTRPSQQEGRAVEPERSRAAPRTPSERSRATRDLPRVETPRSLPEVGDTSGRMPPSGVTASGATPNGAGAEPPPDTGMPEWMQAIWATAPDDMTQDAWADAIIDALRTTPDWFLITIPTWFKQEPPTDLAHACRIISHNAGLHDDINIRLPKGPK